MNPLADGSMSITDQMTKAFEEIKGIRPSFKRGSRNRIARWAAMENWMRTAIDGLPYWMVTKDCPNLVKELTSIMPDENNPEDLDTSMPDHAIDSASEFLTWIKWIDSTQVGGIHQKEEKKRKEPMITKIDFDAFGRIKRRKSTIRPV